MSQKIRDYLEKVAIIFGAIIIALLVTDLLLISKTSTQIQDITRSWKTEPIVSIYVLSSYQNLECSLGYVALPMEHVSLPAISSASCGCTENPFGYVSSSDTCSNGEYSGYCMSFNGLRATTSSSWRGNTLCVKRSGRSAATYKGHYSGRPHPNKHGKCPRKYKKCGDGRNQDQGATCFPDNIECPITNLMVLRSSDPVPYEDGWKPARFFRNDDYVLYFRREYANELPIINITIALSEQVEGRSTRGHCFRGAAQEVQVPVQASNTELWTYTATLPPACATSDPRYQLADSVSLVNGYLRNLHVMEPTCAGLQLYSLNDSRYNQSSDPDYLNSGVKCGTDPRYVCVRDSYQHTDCAVGDDICDGVVHQNICGHYAQAVRSAFSDSSAALGLYYVREIEWSDRCAVSKKDIFNYRKLPGVILQKLGWGVGLFLAISLQMYLQPVNVTQAEEMSNDLTQKDIALLYVIFVLFPVFGMLITVMVEMHQLYSIYKAVESGQCTDGFTAEVIMSRLYPTPLAYWVNWTLFLLTGATSALIIKLVLMKTYEVVAEEPVAESSNRAMREVGRGGDGADGAGGPFPHLPVARATLIELAPVQAQTAPVTHSTARAVCVPVSGVSGEQQGHVYRVVPAEEV